MSKYPIPRFIERVLKKMIDKCTEKRQNLLHNYKHFQDQNNHLAKWFFVLMFGEREIMWFLMVVSAMGYFTLEVKGNGCVWFPKFVDSCSFVLSSIVCFRVLKYTNKIAMEINSCKFTITFKNYVILWHDQVQK